jgi:hypothetical protein
LEKFLGVKMKCEMPDCNNNSTKKITKEGIHYGVFIQDACVNVCEEHTIHEVNNHLEEVFVENCSNLQECNPFIQSEFAKKTSK